MRVGDAACLELLLVLVLVDLLEDVLEAPVVDLQTRDNTSRKKIYMKKMPQGRNTELRGASKRKFPESSKSSETGNYSIY